MKKHFTYLTVLIAILSNSCNKWSNTPDSIVTILEIYLTKRNLYDNNLLDNNFFSSSSHKDRKLNYSLMTTACATPYLFAAFSDNDNYWHEDEGMKPNLKTRTLISAGLFIPTIASGYPMRGSNGTPNDGLLTVQ